MASVRSTDTAPEQAARRAFRAAGFRPALRPSTLPGRPDIVLPVLRAVVFVHGCFWHAHGCVRAMTPETNRAYWVEKRRRNVTRDRRVVRMLRNQSWHVFTIWTCNLNTGVARVIRSLDRLRLASSHA